ncbi:MAG TPA: plastocyanin/azurin family copper-binding protein [Gemmatimonadaceae bacterium]|nr:plastocyanin/azurin family copper-binding protein [Gemmatimonadaceae bacterium]
MKRNIAVLAVLGGATFALACGGDKSQMADTMQMAAPSATAAAPGGPQTPDAGGKIDSVGMYTDATGNYFKPKDFTVHQGDVIRFVLESGVHNASFPADSNKGATGLPAASEYLQIPGQTYDVKVTFAPGSYFYQCDAHALLGMVGRITVEAKP